MGVLLRRPSAMKVVFVLVLCLSSLLESHYLPNKDSRSPTVKKLWSVEDLGRSLNAIDKKLGRSLIDSEESWEVFREGRRLKRSPKKKKGKKGKKSSSEERSSSEESSKEKKKCK